MIVYLLYNKNTILEIESIEDQIDLSAKNCFRVSESKVILKPSNIKIGQKTLDYYCVVDEKIEKDALEKRKAFAHTLYALLQKKSTANIIGDVKIETGFNPDSLSNTIKSKEQNTSTENADNAEFDYDKRAEMYVPQEPLYTFDRVILPETVLNKIEESLATLEYENKVFKEWGLYKIQPNPSSALSFYGASGTGKTMAAEAIADKLKKKILKVSYADIESKFHGEGPKMVKAIFLAAKKEDAVLFIDEADSLLSKRLTNVTQGSEQAINSMRSQLLICLEEYKGIVIFATNLVVNYDNAFLTRLISVEFLRPDKDCQKRIWNVHIKGEGINIPLFNDINTEELTDKFDFCGREIRKSVISACVNVAMNNKSVVTQQDFVTAANKVKAENDRLALAEDNTKTKKSAMTFEQENLIKSAIKANIHTNEPVLVT